MKLSHGLMFTLGLGIALAACSGGGSSGPSGPVCTTPAAQVPELLYPTTASSAVPDAIGILIYQGYAASPNTISLVNGVLAPVTTAATAVPSPLPTGAATPSRAGGTTYAVTFPALASASLFGVYYALPPNCNPSIAQFGYFLTQ